MNHPKLEPALELPSDFRFGEVSSLTALRAASSSVPSLGPLAPFTGTFRGHGFNIIFRPDSTATPTKLPGPISPGDPTDNVLELNLTSETLSFSKSLGSRRSPRSSPTPPPGRRRRQRPTDGLLREMARAGR
jgi:hypothetical protein